MKVYLIFYSTESMSYIIDLALNRNPKAFCFCGFYLLKFTDNVFTLLLCKFVVFISMIMHKAL
jgi:hypothetical protein